MLVEKAGELLLCTVRANPPWTRLGMRQTYTAAIMMYTATISFLTGGFLGSDIRGRDVLVLTALEPSDVALTKAGMTCVALRFSILKV